MLGPCNYLHAETTALAATNNNLNLIDTIVVPGKLRGLFLRVLSDRFWYIDMSATNCKKQNFSP